MLNSCFYCLRWKNQSKCKCTYKPTNVLTLNDVFQTEQLMEQSDAEQCMSIYVGSNPNSHIRINIL